MNWTTKLTVIVSAHAAAAPWEGINALDAAVLAYSSVSALRQQIKPDHRVHGIIEGKDWVPNGQRIEIISRSPLNLKAVIPDYARMQWIARAPSWPEVVALRDRLQKCFEYACP